MFSGMILHNLVNNLVWKDKLPCPKFSNSMVSSPNLLIIEALSVDKDRKRMGGTT